MNNNENEIINSEEPVNNTPRFDPQTGQPLNNTPRFDPQTGQPLNNTPRFDPQTGQPLNNNQQSTKKAQNKALKIVLIIIGTLVIGFILLIVVGLLIINLMVNSSDNKLVCTSDEGNITISYNDETLTGYFEYNITYDLDGQKRIAEEIGTEEYVKQFTEWFQENTSGTCVTERK